MRTLTTTLCLAALATPLFAQGEETKTPSTAEQLEQAKTKATKANKRVLVAFLAADDERCKELASLLGKPELRRYLNYEYELVRADAKTDSALAAKLEVDVTAVPALAVLDAKGSKVATLKRDDIGEPEAKPLMAALKPHQAPPLEAEKVLAATLAAAQKSDRKVLVHLGAPW